MPWSLQWACLLLSTRPSLLAHDLAWPGPGTLTYGLYTCGMYAFACALGVAGGRDGASPSIAPDDLFGCLESFGVVLPAQDEDIVADALREGPGRYWFVPSFVSVCISPLLVPCFLSLSLAPPSLHGKI